MKQGGIGGNKTMTGIHFEGKTDIITYLQTLNNYTVEDNIIFYNGVEVARSYSKHRLYKELLSDLGIDWTACISKKLLPDDALFVIVKNTIYIIEKKYQQVGGSVDEKLQTCDFKKKQYQKLFSRANIEVEYMYLLSDFFKKSCYKDVLDYIISVRCQYYFEYIPLEKIGLPLP